MIRLSIGAFGRHADRPEAGADVQTHHHVLLGQRPEHRAPVVVVVVARKPFQVRQFRHRHRAATLGRHAADLGDHRFGVPRRQDRDRDEAIRVAARPFVDVPVVVGRHHHQRDRFLGHVRWRAENPVNVGKHIDARMPLRPMSSNALMDVVDAGAHLGEAGRVAAPFLRRPRHHGVEAADALRPALIEPLVDALVVGDDDRRLGLVLGGHVIEEHVGRLDDVVVDAHQNQVVDIHDVPLHTVAQPNSASRRTR